MDTDDPATPTIVASNHFAVRGIFFDEVPNIWKSEDAAHLEDAGILVKKIEGILGDRLVSAEPYRKSPGPGFVLRPPADFPQHRDGT